jgi:hypothetical protein
MDSVPLERTAIIEAKLFHQLAAIDRVPAYEIFLDLHKAYDAVDRGRLFEILEAYGAVCPLTRALLLNYWDAQRFVALQAGYHGRPFQLGRGLTQGNPMSPILFNIGVCDAIVGACMAQGRVAWLQGHYGPRRTNKGFHCLLLLCGRWNGGCL